AETIYSGLETFLARELENLKRENPGAGSASASVDTDLIGNAITRQMDNVQKQLAADEKRKGDFDAKKLNAARTNLDKQKEFLNEEGKKAVDAYAKSLDTSAEFTQALASARDDFRRGRKILPRIRLWESYLTKPASRAGDNIARGIGELTMYWLRGAGDIG